MIAHPATAEAFAAVTLEKLRAILTSDEALDAAEHLIEKARSREKQVYHPLLRVLRRLVADKSGIRLTYKVKGGRIHPDHVGVPYKPEYSMVKREWYLLLESRRSEAVIEVVRRLSRILYAFSSFEKDVHYDAESDTYRVKVRLLSDEFEYLLSKIRFLGQRVRVVEGDYLKKQMFESAAKALARYEAAEAVAAADEELSS